MLKLDLVVSISIIIDKSLSINSRLIDGIEDLDIYVSPRLDDNNIIKKLNFEIPSFGERHKQKLMSSKNLFNFDSLKKSVLGTKNLEINTTDFNTMITDSRTTVSTYNSNQFTKLDYDPITLDENEVFVSESFADVFFIAGLPYKNSKVISESENFNPLCKHNECSILQSYKADILHRFPTVNYKGFELSSSVI